MLAVGVSIEGEGSTVSIIKANYAADPLINLSSGTGNTNGNQSISYLKLDGNLLKGTLAISVYQRGNVKKHDCDFVDFNYEAMNCIMITFAPKSPLFTSLPLTIGGILDLAWLTIDLGILSSVSNAL